MIAILQDRKGFVKHWFIRDEDEFTWRLNDGDVKRHTLQRLDSFIDAIVGKRLTYARLIARVVPA